jgi:DNA-binding NtrC family response regulator
MLAPGWATRELRNVVERACMLCEGKFLSERDFGRLSGTPELTEHTQRDETTGGV